jgi:hypothetical protein
MRERKVVIMMVMTIENSLKLLTHNYKGFEKPCQSNLLET